MDAQEQLEQCAENHNNCQNSIEKTENDYKKIVKKFNNVKILPNVQRSKIVKKICA